MDETYQLLIDTPWLLYCATLLLGLCIGSFINVVIYRLPIMLEQQWRRDTIDTSHDHLYTPNLLGLATPASHCPHCQRPVRALENIPVLSFMWLRGQCKGCGAKISWQYPAIEILCALLSVIVVAALGLSWQAAAALILTYALVALSCIDMRHQILPDYITLPMLWLGLLLNTTTLFATPAESILGAVIGYLVLWLVYHGYKKVTGKEGMGYGDFKLLAMLGAWLGVGSLPLIILISSISGTIIGLILIGLGTFSKNAPIPFGPFLAIAGFIGLIWGKSITDWYVFNFVAGI